MQLESNINFLKKLHLQDQRLSVSPSITYKNNTFLIYINHYIWTQSQVIKFNPHAQLKPWIKKFHP
jgi:hypothetical protein